MVSIFHSFRLHEGAIAFLTRRRLEKKLTVALGSTHG